MFQEPTRQEMISHVKSYAARLYERGLGWDYVVECLSDSDIEELLGRARTLNGAVMAVWNKYVRSIHEQSRNCRFEC